jgi:hypothetical protein
LSQEPLRFAPIKLPAGEYLVEGLWVINGSGQVVVAAPFSTSAKASLVQHPLSLTASLQQVGTVDLPVEVVAVKATDRASDFGYPEGTFPPVDDAPVEEKIKIKVQAVITVGSINYDSIPAQFHITSWDELGAKHERDTLLDGGIDEVSFPKSHTKFELRFSKWGVSDALVLNRNEVDQHVVYTLGGSKAARKLLREETFLEVMGQYQPKGKAIYHYDGGALKQVDYFQKFPQHAELQFTQKHVYKYSGTLVSRIDVMDAANVATGFTTFTYNPQGTKITNMHQKSYDVETFAAVDYGYAGSHAEITFDYLYNNGNSMEYKMKIVKGNKTEDGAVSSTGGGEGGTYAYDCNINPFAHMNMPNLYLSNISRNNVISQQKGFGGSIPSAVLYKFEYIYDSEGYPTDVIKYYKSGMTGEHIYKTKTVYTY